MSNTSNTFQRLINEFTKLPGVGAKTAQRYAYSVVKMSDAEAKSFAEAVIEAKRAIKYCSVCGNFTDVDPCAVCKNRDHSAICVVAEPKDVLAMEKVQGYSGAYHVLHGLLSPLENKGPDDIRIKELIARISKGGVKEVILATNPNVEGEATAVYIAKLLRPLGIKTTRLAQGISVGSELEYADEVTLTQALNNRKEI